MFQIGRFRFSPKLFRRAVILISIVALGIMLWKLDLRTVWRIVEHVGYGVLLIVALQIGALAFNALGWRFSFRSGQAHHYGMVELAKLWMTMDGINYFVPSGTVAGEVVRVSMLRDVVPLETRTASIVVSRAGQTIAQLGFIILGLAFLVSQVRAAQKIGWAEDAAFWTFIVLLVLTVLSLLARRWLQPRATQLVRKTRGWVRDMFRQIRIYLTNDPWRFAAAVIAFTAGYAWGAVEAFWICYFIGIHVSALLALTIEVLSVAVDGVLFMIPAKIGSQELGKAAIFTVLSLPISAGVAFGIVRHIREIFWALAGFGAYSIGRPKYAAARSLEQAMHVSSERDLRRGS